MVNWGVFLDRDGVIVRQIDHLNHAEDLELIPGAGEAIARLNAVGIPVIVVTNQAGVAKGYLTIADLEEIHARLRSELAKWEAHIDALYYCPHHPQATVTEYLKDCPCRKPGTGTLERARDEQGIDPALSYLVGDSTSDILAGKRAGCRTILVRTGFAGKDGLYEVKPDLVVANLAAAVETILAETGEERIRR
ncbi:MAG: HAD-IIIA family hydrolase [Candidatus Bipolaricaulota bacterium]|nr:HAD-IIIA family hydrolase [Candidatus Bipolaricaulota bacterium]